MKVMAAPIPVGELAMIAIQMRYIDFTAPPTHRSLASHIGQVIELGPTGIGSKEQREENSDSISPRCYASAISVPIPYAAKDRGFTTCLPAYALSG